jgi:hypothetical protein
MRTARILIPLITFAVLATGCTPPAPPTNSTASASAPGAPSGVDLNAAAAVPLIIGPSGGHATVPSGDWTVVVSVPGGSAPAGAHWTMSPLKTAPTAVADALTPGVYVDEAGQAPTGDCLIGFAMKGKPSAEASIVRLAADGTNAEVVATVRQETKNGALLLAEVTGFSAYTVAKTTPAARKTAQDQRAKQAKKLYAIRVHDKARFTKLDWKFEFVLDLELTGGSADASGNYTGNATLTVTGAYTKDLGGVIQGQGKVKGSAKGAATATLTGLQLGTLLPLDDDFPYQMEEPTGVGTMALASKGALKISVDTPQGAGSIPVIKADGKDVAPYRLKVEGTKVTVEIAQVGEFEGKLVKL